MAYTGQVKLNDDVFVKRDSQCKKLLADKVKISGIKETIFKLKNKTKLK